MVQKKYISEREHIEREIQEYFSSEEVVLFSDGNNSSIYFPEGFKLQGSSLDSVSGIAKILDKVLGDISSEFADPSKRVHGRHYTYNGRMYRWDAKDQELIRVLTHDEIEFAKEFFSQPPIKKDASKNPHSCKFKKHYSQDSNWSLCAYEGNCGNKERLTCIQHGMYGRDWFCGPTCM